MKRIQRKKSLVGWTIKDWREYFWKGKGFIWHPLIVEKHRIKKGGVKVRITIEQIK